MNKIIALLSTLFISLIGYSQSLYIPGNIQKAYDKGTRSADGSPGKNYWQNFGDYDLKIKFDPTTRLVEGSAVITYTNNSPDTLKELVIRLYPNFYLKGGLRDIAIAHEDESDGVIIEKLIVNDSLIDTTAKGKKVERKFTNWTVFCYRILPKQVSKIQVKWHYTLNKGSHSRTGQIDEGAFFIAYCFPRIAVYDDLDGWDKNVFMGNNEPYFDFGNFNAEVTVPNGYVVWGTGELQNANEVFAPEILKKHKASFVSEKIIDVIDSNDLKKNNITVKNNWNTFKFKAAYVPDFSFALSNHYIWQSSSMIVDKTTKRRASINTVFNQKHKDFFEVHSFSRKTVEIMSFDFPGVAYPYPHITVVDGLDQMEYPMMVNDNPLEKREETIELTDHEIFHMFFPFYMGTNQTKYSWMDEGWATIGEWYITPKIDSSIVDAYGMDRVKKFTGKDYDVPMIIPSTENKLSYFINAYPKPALVYLYLKDMLGDELFRKTIQYYMKTWNGKHPMPWDFFNCVNKASGQDLNWFWQAWFYDWSGIDLGIKNVEKKNVRESDVTNDKRIDVVKGPTVYSVIIENKGGKPVPIYIKVTFSDGSKREYHESVLVWKNKKEFTITVSENKEILNIHLDNVYVPDGNELNDHWRR